VKEVSLCDRCLSAEFADVSTGDKCFLTCSGYDENPNRIIALQLIESRDAFGVNLLVQRIEFVRPVDRHDGDTGVAFFKGDCFVAHKCVGQAVSLSGAIVSVYEKRLWRKHGQARKPVLRRYSSIPSTTLSSAIHATKSRSQLSFDSMIETPTRDVP
jgi:hypothetical protein